MKHWLLMLVMKCWLLSARDEVLVYEVLECEVLVHEVLAYEVLSM